MATIKTNGWPAISMPGLGRNKPLPDLSEKRVTGAVREALRNTCGGARVHVVCKTTLSNGVWSGRCSIGGVSRGYTVT